MDAAGLREYITEAIKFWEPARIGYNLVLAAVVILHFVAAYPDSKRVLNLDSGLGLFLLAVIANVAYCAAYVPDIFAQASGFRELWGKVRWVVLAIGTVFAATLAHFLSRGMFPAP